jgi:Leucine-rich repeat (LRR) protein
MKILDSNFLAALKPEVKTNNNEEISVAKALEVIHLYIYNRSIASLEGIQYFTNLQTLECSINQLTTLDVQGLTNLKILVCFNNQLPSLNLQGLTNLQDLLCNNNQLTILNLQGLTSLKGLNCGSNQFSSLNLQDLTNLQILSCGNNPLKEITGLENCTKLEHFHALNVKIPNSYRFFTNPINQRTVFRRKDNMIVAGCFCGTILEFIEEVKIKYNKNHPYIEWALLESSTQF